MNSANSKASGSSSPVVAIIGGGQLGYLLCEAARPLGIGTLIVTPDPDAPALKAADETIVADYREPGLARQIAAAATTVTFEFEAVPEELLAALESEPLHIYPALAVLRLLKNKARQKDWMVAHDIPTAEYIAVTADEVTGRTFIDKVSFPFVQKAQEGGYDGYGVQIIRNAAELERLWPVPSIIESFLHDARELAVVAARSVSGETEVYPPVELTVDEARNILDMVIVPAPLTPGLSAEAESLARSVVEGLGEIGGVGVFAVEMFLADGKLLVNEISPRVHNSGHHTIESCTVSQFEQHMRAVAGLPLAAVKLATSAVMKNILYEDALAPLIESEPGLLPVPTESVSVHWYGKKHPRAGRKMGHATCVGVEPAQGSKLIDETLAGLVSQ